MGMIAADCAATGPEDCDPPRRTVFAAGDGSDDAGDCPTVVAPAACGRIATCHLGETFITTGSVRPQTSGASRTRCRSEAAATRSDAAKISPVAKITVSLATKAGANDIIMLLPCCELSR